MAITTTVLRLQSDQILDGPTIGTALNLKNLNDTRRLQIVWVHPAVDPAPLLFKDPGILPAPVGTVSVSFASPTVNGSGTTFLTTFSVGQAVTFASQPAVVYTIQSISSNILLTLTTAYSGTTNASTTINQSGADTVVYENLTQSLKNKNLNDPTNTMPDQPQYLHLAGQAGGQTAHGGTADGENLKLRSTSAVTKGQVQIDVDDLAMGLNKNILMNGGELIGLPAVPSGATAAASKAYVDTSISGGAAWKETLLSAVQLDNANKAIAQADAFYLAAQPVNGDTVQLSDVSTVETFTFQAVSAPFQPQIGGTVLITMQNLAARINTDSTKWSAQVFTTLQGINPTGNVLIVWRKVPTTAVLDRIYGTFGTPANAKIVNYFNLLDYRSSTVVNMPGADPGANTFGISRTTAFLSPDEAHIVRAEDSIYLWNQDAETWQLSGGAVSLATSGPGGGAIGQSTFDSNKGLQVAAGVAEVKVDGASISFNGGGQLQVAGGAVPVGTSAPGGGTTGKVTADENFGLQIVPSGIMRAVVDGTTMTFDGFGRLHSTPVTQVPIGQISFGCLLTQNIPATAPPVSGTVATDIPTQRYQHLQTQGQLFDFVVPDDYDSASIEIMAVYQMSAAQAANVRFQTQAKIVKIGGSVDTTTYPATGATFTPGNNTNWARQTLLSITNGTFSRGDTIQFYFTRLGSDVLDTHTGEMVVVAFEVRYTGQVSTRAAIQTADVFGGVVGFPAPPAGFFNTDIPTIDYSNSVDQAAAAYFIVPDNWDGSSDAFIRIQYALSSASAGNVDIVTSGNIVDVVSGSIVSIPDQSFVIVVTGDTNPHRTTVIRSIPSSMLTKGSFIELAIRRNTATGGNSAADFRIINATITFAVVPNSGFVNQTDQYLSGGVFGNPVGMISGDTVFPDVAGDFESYYRMTATAASSSMDLAFEGVLEATQLSISNIKLFIKGSGATPQYSVKVYVEGTVGAVYSVGPVAAPLTITALNSGVIGTNPINNKRFIVIITASLNNGDALFVGRPIASRA